MLWKLTVNNPHEDQPTERTIFATSLTSAIGRAAEWIHPDFVSFTLQKML